MADYTNFDNNSTPIKEKKQFVNTTAYNMAKVFGYMAIGILITAVFTGLFGWLIYSTCECVRVGEYIEMYNFDAYIGFTVGGIVPLIGMLVCSILAGSFSFKHRQQSRSVAIPAVIYCACIGYLFGLIFPFLPFEVIAISLGASIVVFASLALVGLVSKGNMNPLMYLAMGLLSGIFIISIINLILMWFVPTVVVNASFWIVSLGIFVVLMLTTIWDVWHIKTIVSQNDTTPNLTLFWKSKKL